MEKPFIFLVFVLILESCTQTITTQALQPDASDKNIAEQIVVGSNLVSGTGMYRIWFDKNENLRAAKLCPDDINKNNAFKILTLTKTAGHTPSISDQKISDNFTITLDPLSKERSFDDFKAAIGVTFKGVPGSRRVAEGYSVTEIGGNVSEDGDVLSSDFVYKSLNRDCREKNVDNRESYRNKGKPVYIYKIADAKKVYTKFVGFPTFNASISKDGKKIGDFVIGPTGDVIYDTGYDKVFGYQFFGVGKFKNEAIPHIKK